ncbi:Cytochrome c-type biogenesis protein CycH [Nymphon striatum]|nr:Cytochrome c-type biogenesis protein CycH [Nymphon striatum]
MEQLRETVAQRPDDLQGHILLAQNEARMGDFGAAAVAQEKALRIKGDGITASDVSDYGELLVLAAGGYVSPEAETAFRAALARDETDERARYYVGLMMVQTGRPDIAFRLWDALLRRGPEDAPWIAPILAQIKDVSFLAGVDYTLPSIGAGAARGPTIEDMEAASDMTAEEAHGNDWWHGCRINARIPRDSAVKVRWCVILVGRKGTQTCKAEHFGLDFGPSNIPKCIKPYDIRQHFGTYMLSKVRVASHSSCAELRAEIGDHAPLLRGCGIGGPWRNSVQQANNQRQNAKDHLQGVRAQLRHHQHANHCPDHDPRSPAAQDVPIHRAFLVVA